MTLIKFTIDFVGSNLSVIRNTEKQPETPLVKYIPLIFQSNLIFFNTHASSKDTVGGWKLVFLIES